LGGTKIRETNVVAGESFIHPHWKDLPGLGDKIVEQMNKLTKISKTLPDDQIDLLIHKFYLLFSTIHLPTDGSGRLNGDVNTILQKSVQIALKRNGRTIVPKLISHTGYRMSGAEDWAMTEQTLYRTRLICDVMKLMTDKNFFFRLLGIPNNEHGIDHPKKAEQMLETYKHEFDNELISSGYYKALNIVLCQQIESMFDLSPTSWINHLSKSALHRRRHAYTSDTYIPTAALNPDHVPILDTIVSLHEYEENHQLALLLASQRITSHRLTAHPITRRIIAEVYQGLKRRNHRLARLIVNENPNLPVANG